ncbi:hypothetical protein SKAU_G00424560 [Synaphobranchus kaupii]|uniref:Uncharacterized protein n=1 Tax=Synaphobranchus kaupii TaxID=118154 RepID=A0A9Q1E5L7_SYNKA|nr:hypothetical protein SKAU_G00424560 [Synaphobranchus kaupii]
MGKHSTGIVTDTRDLRGNKHWVSSVETVEVFPGFRCVCQEVGLENWTEPRVRMPEVPWVRDWAPGSVLVLARFGAEESIPPARPPPPIQCAFM